MGDVVLRSELRTGDLEQPVRMARVRSSDAPPVGVEHATEIPVAPAGLGSRGDSSARAAQVYVVAVIAAGAYSIVAFLPLSFPRPFLFAFLLITSCLTSVWKVNLPIPLASGSTLSVSYTADLMTLLLLGPRAAVLVAAAGVWTQCTVKIKRPYPLYRTIFSIAAEALTMAVTGVLYGWLGGPSAPVDWSSLARPLVGTIGTYFVVNTGLIAAAIALTSQRTFVQVWFEDFLWSGASFMVAGRRGCRGRRDRARRALESRADAGAGVSDVPNLSGVRRPARGSRSSRARDAAAPRRDRRGALAGASG